MKEKIYNFENRLVQFAGETMFYTKTLPFDYNGNYYHENSEK